MMKVYRVDGNATKPYEVECDEPGYPNRDAEGRTMYVNSHFVEVDEAWRCLCRDIEAHVELSANRVVEAREKLREAEKAAADAIVRHVEFEKNYDTYKETL